MSFLTLHSLKSDEGVPKNQTFEYKCMIQKQLIMNEIVEKNGFDLSSESSLNSLFK